MTFSVISLNIEGDCHFGRFIPELVKRNPDVVCLQEVFEADLPELAVRLGFLPSQCAFLAMSHMGANTYHISERGRWGIAMFTSLAHDGFKRLYYKGDGTAPIFSTPNSVDRGLLYTTLHSADNRIVPIATTHFTWTGDGEVSPEQERDFKALKNIVVSLPPHVLCGDFNAPRGREMFAQFEALYKDSVPPEITTTIDNALHQSSKDLQLVVDTAFYQDPLNVACIEVIAGVSDHKAIHFRVHCE